MMSIQALVTAVELHLPIVVLIWEDNQYGLIKWKQEAAFHQHSHIDLVNPDLVKVAEAFGCQGLAVESAAQFPQVLQQAFAETKRPSVVVVPVDYAENMKLTQHLGEILSR